MTNMQDCLIDVAKFTPASMEFPSAWIGHLPFAAWLIKLVMPETFVELGTHYGHSYFSFCQGVSEGGLSTKCYAVDTWKGEEHAGYYGEEVFHQVNSHNQEHYADFSRLLRMKFDEAVSYFSDGSIDLLHIDGLHTYEAVKHDFETWLPKLTPGAVVLLHDTNVREHGFGVWALWEELRDRYPKNLEFIHSHGLGVLQLDGGPEKKRLEWLQRSSPMQKRLKDYFSALGLRMIERFELHQLRNNIYSLNQAVAERDGQITGLNQAVAERDGQITGLNQAVAERDGQITGLNQAAAERDEKIQTLNQAVDERDGQITGLNQAVAERDGQIISLNQGLAGRDGQIASLLHDISAIRHSTSWKITAPIRWLSHQLKRAQHFKIFTTRALEAGGGLCPAMEKAWWLLRNEGLDGLKRGVAFVQRQDAINATENSEGYDRNDYEEWILRYDKLDGTSRQRIKDKIASFPQKPKISVLMPVYDPPVKFLDAAIWSVRKQLYPDWELCIADDASKNQAVRDLLTKHAREDSRIKVVFRDTNGHISAASNSALELVSGEYVALLDHDDLLAEHALFFVAQTVMNYPDAGLIYSDEDKVDEKDGRSLPFFKPDWSPHLAISQAYLGHLVCIKTTLLHNVGGWQNEKNGAQDYDLWLRVALQSPQIKHIPRVLYHWRMHRNSTAQNTNSKPYAHKAGRLAVQDYLRKRYPEKNIDVCDGKNLFTYQARFNLDPGLMVSIIIPTRDRADLLGGCIDSILKVSSWKNFEILILDNGSKEFETIKFLENIHDVDPRVRVVTANIPFNWSRLNNIGASHCKGDVFIFLNNDIVVLSNDWIQYLAGYASLPDVGTVGGLLLFEDGSIQHCGVVVGMGGWADHVFRLQRLVHSGGGPFVSPFLTRNVLAVTGACMAISREKYFQLGGFDEEFVICGSDVEIGLRAHAKKLYNIMCAEAKLIHFESKTRTSHIPPEDFILSEQKYKPYRVDQVDPFFNPNLSLKSTRPTIEMEPRHDTKNY